MNIKRWTVEQLNKERAAQIAEEHQIPFFAAMLLDIRGFHTEEEITDFLSSEPDLPDPFLLRDMDKAVERIHTAIENFEKIAIFGDYDADGVTATAMLYNYLETLGTDVIHYITKRDEEGYGMNNNAIDYLHSQGVELIITVDNGIASVDEVNHAASLGIDVVITDHHRPHEELPKAVAVVDPFREDCEYPFKELSGAGVALNLLIALENGDQDIILSEYADLAAIGTIADVMPVLGENRKIIKLGMEEMITDPKPGISALIKSSSVDVNRLTARSLAFTIIPRINATGRMGTSEKAVKLLSSEYEEEADEIASEIDGDNTDRKGIEVEITATVLEQIRSDERYKYDRVIVISGDSWHNGVIGIVASRIVDHFGKPCMIIATEDGVGKGSGRSIDGFSMFDAITSCGDIFVKFGGHAMAAGITIEESKIDEFRTKINEYAKIHHEFMPTQSVKLDCKLNPQSLSVQMPLDLQLLEPFGTGNPQPVFGLFDMKLSDIKPVGNGAHLRLTCSRDGHHVTCMKFGTRLEEFPYEVGDIVDMAVVLEAKEYRGQNQMTVIVRREKFGELDVDNMIRTYQLYEKTKRNEPLEEEQALEITPTRDDIAAIYLALKAYDGKDVNLQRVLRDIKNDSNIGKLMLSLEILKERGLIDFKVLEYTLSVEIKETNGTKMNIYDSPIFATIKELVKAVG